MKFENQAWEITHNVWMYGHSYDLGRGAKGLEQWLLGGSFSSSADGLLQSPLKRSLWAGEALRDPCTKIPMLSSNKSDSATQAWGITQISDTDISKLTRSEIHHRSEYSDLDSYHINLR